MTRLPATEAEYQATSYYHWAQEGRPQEHAFGTSCDNLVGMSGQVEAMQVPAAAQLHQPASSIPKPQRSEAAPVVSSSLESSPREGSCLDQYHAMLPSNPVQQLPLLPTTCTSATVRVAAWLLDHGAGGAGNDAAGQVGRDYRQEQDQDHEVAGAECGDSADACSDHAALLEELDEHPLEAVQARVQVQAAAPAVPADCEGYRVTDYYCETRRRSLDAFMSQPVQHGDTLNNYMASLY